MAILGNPRFSRTLPLSMFERLQELLQQMQVKVGRDAVLLRSQDLPIVSVGLDQQVQRFTVLVSPVFRALLIAAAIESPGETETNAHSSLYQVGLTFESDAIADFLDGLTQRFTNSPQIFHIFQLAQTYPEPNQGDIQSEFTLLLMDVLSANPISNEPIYPYCEVAQPIEAALRQQVEQERLINQVTTHIRQSLELPVILSTAVDEVRHFLDVDRLLIYQFDGDLVNLSEEGNKTEVDNSTDVADQFENAKSLTSPLPSQQDEGCVTYEARYSDKIGSVLNWREEKDCALHIPNCRTRYHQGFTGAIDDIEVAYSDSPCLLQLLRQTQVKAKLVAPIIVQNRLWGLLIAHQCFAPRHWQESEKLFLKQIAEHLAVAIYQAQLYAQAHQQKSNLEQRVIERTQELRDALQATQAANHAKSEFLAAMSHELRTPLTCVIGLSATLLRWSWGEGGSKTVSLEKQRHYLQTIQENGEHLLELINDILDFSQLEAGKAVLNISEFSLWYLAQQTLQSLKEKARSSQIELTLDWQVPTQKDRFQADPRRLRQILFNLLGNAIKFTPAGGQVTLRGWREHNLAVFQIEDTGIGIPQEQIPLMFQKFQQLETTYQRTYEGTGLGLALTKQLVELHGGTIEVESTVGKGSIFTVCLPIQSVVSGATKSAAPSGKGSPVPGSIVLIENNEASATAICEILTAAGYHLVWLIESSTAVRQIELLQPHAVIVDWQLSAMDGYEISYYLHHKTTTAHIKVLALITSSLSADEQQDLNALVDDYLPKPVEPAQLLQKVATLMAI
ncbi:hybrid sensor histidine kinase/response regulator [Coleofasciculus sp. G2-EDA-02]|uniref:hybrid sensor histidine kinase/response regulator n=1 Tax=Coleofasciculus sp. G2-EDA-02 TaxID=3069529 RepID=UPI00406387DC